MMIVYQKKKTRLNLSPIVLIYYHRPTLQILQVCVASVPKLDMLYNVLGSTSADKAARLVPLDNIFPAKGNVHAC